MRPAPKAALAAAAVVLAGLLALQSVFSARSLLGVYHATQGSAALRANDAAGAREAFQRAAAAVPFHADYARLEAAAARESDGADAAAPIYAEALRHAPYTPLLLLAAAETETERRHFKEAEALLHRLESLTPDEWRLHVMRGEQYLRDEEYEKARDELQSGERLASPPPPGVAFKLANALYALGDHDAAIRAADRALRVAPQRPEYHVARGKALLATSRLEEARKEFVYAEKVYLELLGSDSDALSPLVEAQDFLAISLLALGEFGDAERKLDELYTRLSPEQIDHFAGRMFEMVRRMSDPFPAVPLWARALDMLVQTGRLDEFDHLLASARMLYPESELGELVPPRARALTAAGDPDGAIALLATAPFNVVDTPPYRLALAEAHAAAGRNAAARIEYAMLIGIEGLSPAVRKQAEAALAAIPVQ